MLTLYKYVLIINKSQNDRQIFVGFRKHSRSFVWRCEYYATLTLWRISCVCKTFIFAAYSPEMIRLPRRITEKVRPFKWLRMLPNFLRIPANFLRSLRSVCRISCESFANVKTTYECLTITTNALPSISIGVRDGGQGAIAPPPNSGSLSTSIRAESRHYSGKTQYMFD